VRSDVAADDAGSMIDKPAISQRTQQQLEQHADEVAELRTELERCYQTIENLTATIAFQRKQQRRGR